MAVLGFYLGALACLNPALTVAYPLLVLWPLTTIYGACPRPLSHGVALTLVGWAVAITPWTIRNYVQMGQLVYIRYGLPLALWLGVCPEADAHGAAVYARQFPLTNAQVQSEVSAMGEQAFIVDRGKKAVAAMRNDPARFLKLIGWRVADYWLGTMYTHQRPNGGPFPEDPVRLAVAVFLTTEVVVLFLCLMIRRRASIEVVSLVGVVVVFSVVYCLTHVQVRFRAPAEPVLAVAIAVLAVETIQQRWRGRSTPLREA